MSSTGPQGVRGIGSTTKVLDHGYVKLIGWMGTDETIIESARMSTGKGFIGWEPMGKVCKHCGKQEAVCTLGTCLGGGQHEPEEHKGDAKLLEFMWKNGHSTPFEFCELTVEVQAPIFVFREWHRHRTQAYSEFSARYSQMPNLHYLPEESRIQKQGISNRQGSEAEVHPDALEILRRLENEQDDVYGHYRELVEDEGVAKEIARLNTPVSRYSKMRAKTDLRNWLGFLALRMAPNAQFEIRQYANAVAEIVKELWPRTWVLFEEHTLGAVKLSKSEQRVLMADIHTAMSQNQITLRPESLSALKKLEAGK